MLVTHLPLNRRSPALALAVRKIPREICPALGVAVLKSDTGADNTMEALQNNVGPDASDAAYRDIIMSPALRRAHLTLDEHSAHAQSARQRAEARLPDGGISPGASFPSLRIHNEVIRQNQESKISLT